VEIPVGGSFVNARVAIRQSPVVVIATHPWGPLGGSMHDPHPTTACRVFGAAGCSTARFDFRSGIGSGQSSIDDVIAVADWFTTAHQGRDVPEASQVLLVGYSYGSLIASAASAEIPRCIAWVAIGPPIDYGWALYVFNTSNILEQAAGCEGRPKMVIKGTADQYCSDSTLESFVQTLPEPKQMKLLPDVDHFGVSSHLKRLLTDWTLSSFKVSSMREFAEFGATALGDLPR